MYAWEGEEAIGLIERWTLRKGIGCFYGAVIANEALSLSHRARQQ